MPKFFTIPFVSLMFISCQVSSLSLSFGSLFLQHNYEEIGGDNNKLLTEKGKLWGVFSQVSHQFENQIKVDFLYSGSKGDTDYDGATQTGTPLQSETEQDFQQLKLSFQYPFHYRQFSISPYISYANWQWDREIQATDITLSLGLEYEWDETAVGIRVGHPLPWGGLSFLWQRLKNDNGSAVVDLSAASLGKPSLNLGDQYGNKFVVEHSFSGSSNWTFSQNLFYSKQGFTASEPTRILQGSRIIRLQEPQSETEQFGLGLALEYSFD